ncbi:MAG: S41 family peptidase, partial [Planctomycetes bacterium]|nr:S41 family peptidase [Planctomycetota bacterium]
GPPGTYVNLGIRRGNNPQLLSFRLRRAQIRVASVDGFKRNPVTGQWRFMIAPTSRIGYIRVTQFQQNTAAELAAAWRHLARHRVRGLIIDLRYNPGGLLETALRMCNMFLPAGTILSTKGRTQPRHVWTADGNPLVPPSIPLVVLVNQDSASAAEIFSGSMKDLHRALIVGHQTFGKGSVQNLIRRGLNAQALIKLTMAHYYLPDGECIQRLPHAATWGVEPNVRVPFSPWQMGLLQRTWEQKDILPPHRSASSASPPPPSTRPATTRPTGRGRLAERSFDTQLDTALLLLRLQLAQARD